MLQKLRSRHHLDLPYEGFERRRPTLAILGGLFLLFVLLPFLLALYGGLFDGTSLDRGVALGVALAMGALVLVLVVAGIRGKPGY